MNKILLITFLILTATAVNAQSPLITNFRQVIAQRDTNFKSLQQDMVQDNFEKGVKVYNGSLGQSYICNAVITQSTAQGVMYVFIYNIKDMDTMQLNIFSTMAQQYITELNDMVKTGNYKGRDSEEGENMVTEITDLNGKIVVQYASSPIDHMILVHGVN